MGKAEAIRAGLDAVLSVVLASSCTACGELLEHPTRGPVCEVCWRSIRPITPPVCDRCGDPLPAWRLISVGLAQCPRCRRARPIVDRARAIGEYDGALRAVIHALKYEGRRSLARPLAALTILLDIAPETAANRKAVDRDRYERDLALLARVRESYQRQAAGGRWVVVDGEQSKDDIAEEVFTVVRLRLALP